MNKKKGYGWLISAGIIAVLVLAAYLTFARPPTPDNSGLPAYALIGSRVKEAYLFAESNPSALDGVNCHCGCMRTVHEGRIHKRGLIDCFKKEDGSFDQHGSQCVMCVNDALNVKSLIAANKTKDQIKSIIDNQYIGKA